MRSTVLTLLLVILLVISMSSAQIIDRTATTDTEQLINGQKKTTLYTSPINIQLSNGTYYPFEDYITVSNDRGKLKFQTLDKGACWLELDYELKRQIETPNIQFDINKRKGSWYFTTDIGRDVNSMAYVVNCTNGRPNFNNNKFTFLDDVTIDFQQAEDLQNISTVYNRTTDKLEFDIIDGKSGGLRMIDPTVEYNFSANEGINMFAYDTGSSASCGGIPTVPHPICADTDLTGDAALDADDSSRVQDIDSGNLNATFLFSGFINISDLKSMNDITLLNWTWVGISNLAAGNTTFYLWNDTQPNYTLFHSEDISNVDTYVDISTSNTPSDFVNASNYTNLILFNDVEFFTDYITLEITYNDAPGVPNLITPNRNFTTLSPLLHWGNVTPGSEGNPITYHIQVDNDTDFSSIDYENHNVIEGANLTGTNSTNSTADIVGPLFEANFSWRVRATSPTGINSSFSITRTFTVDITPANISIVFPINASNHSVQDIDINFTLFDTGGGFAQCWWSNNSGTDNYSIGNCSDTNTPNITNVSWTEGFHNITVYVNDTVNNVGQANISFTIDLTEPESNITSITTTQGSQTVRFNHTATDLNLNNCFFNVIQNGSIDIANTTVSNCSSNGTQLVVSSFNTFILNFYANDSAGNLNSTSQNFTTEDTPGGGGSGGGGGGGGGGVAPITVVALIAPTDPITLAVIEINTFFADTLTRAILYAKINELCIDINSGNCVLSDLKLTELREDLIDFNIDISLDDLKLWVTQYNNKEVENVDVSPSNVDKFNLITAVITLIPEDFRVNPSNLDTIWLIIGDTFTTTISSNKELESVSIIEGELGFTIEPIGDTQARITYTLQSAPSFAFRNFQARANYVDREGNSVFQNINIRGINPSFNIFPGITIAILFISLFILIILSLVFRKQIRQRLRRFKI